MVRHAPVEWMLGTRTGVPGHVALLVCAIVCALVLVPFVIYRAATYSGGTTLRDKTIVAHKLRRAGATEAYVRAKLE